MIYYGTEQQKHKISNLLAMMIGFMIGIALLSYTMAQRETPNTEQTINRDDYWLSDVSTNETGDKLKQTGDQEHRQTNPDPRKQESRETKGSITEDRDSTTIQGKSVNGKIAIKGFPEDSIANLVANKAYKERGLDLVLTLIGENGSFKLDRQSDCTSNGIRERSFGLCQLSYKYHKPFIDSPDFKDREKQTAYCIEVWDDAKRKGTMPFNAYWVRNNYKNRIIYK